MSAAEPVRRRASEFFTGVGALMRGFRLWATDPGAVLLGLIPAVIVGTLYLVLILVLLMNLDPLVGWITPFAADWTEPFRSLFRIFTGFALVAAGALVLVFTFAAVTLAVGSPFYERIAQVTEHRLGSPPEEPQGGPWAAFGRAVGDGIRLVLLSALLGLLLFVGGFIPIVGQIVVPVVGVLVGGWLLGLELTGFAFEARGLRLRDKRRMLAARRWRTLGFGTAAYVLFLLPLGAVIGMPAAVAGGTALGRAAIEENAAAR